MPDGVDNGMIRQLEAAKVLKFNLKEDAEDLDLLSDMIEGETDLFELAEALYNAIKEDEEIINGIKIRADELKRRSNRYKMRMDRRKAMLLQAVTILGEKLTLPSVTLSKRMGAMVLKIDDEGEVPTQYFKRPPPEIDKAALKDALKSLEKSDETIPGCHLERGADSLSMRVA